MPTQTHQIHFSAAEPPFYMAKKALIIDDAAHFRILIRRMLKTCLPDMVIDEYDPLVKEKPDHDFPWDDYDILLLDYNLGKHNGLDWYEEFSALEGFPPTIMFTGEGNELIAVKAMRTGIDDYLPKKGITVEVLKTSINETLQRRQDLNTTTTLQLSTDQILESSPVLAHTLLLHPKAIPNHTILERLGSGASSIVYLAQENDTKEKVVLKVLDPERDNDQNMLERFLEEHRIISTIQTPYIATIYKQGINDDFCYIAMEYFPNGSLRSKIAQGLKKARSLSYLTQMIKALHAIHKRGIIHRDIKPENIMLRADDSIALVDFGIAKQLGIETGFTRQGEIYGTPHYISPEQISGNNKPDARSDLYSLGVVLYEMISGHRPFKADSLPALFYQQTCVVPPFLRDPLDPIIQKLLKKDPEKRFQNARELMNALEQHCKL